MLEGTSREEVYIKKSIQDYEEITIVYGNDQAIGSFVRTSLQNFRSLGARMEQSLTSSMVDLDDQTQGFNDFDDIALSQPFNNDASTSSTSKAFEVKNEQNMLR